MLTHLVLMKPRADLSAAATATGSSARSSGRFGRFPRDVACELAVGSSMEPVTSHACPRRPTT